MNEINVLVEPAPVIPIAVQWDYENPAQALQALCDTLGYRVVYQPALDKVVICPEGEGFPIPDTYPIMGGFDGIAPPTRPNAIQLVGGDVIYNDYFQLEPVTLELDGSIVDLNSASYTPPVGWARMDPRGEFKPVRTAFGPEQQQLAQQHAFRTFRIKIRDVTTGDNSGITIPKFGLITDRKQIVLEPHIYGRTRDIHGNLQTEPAYVVGSVFMVLDRGQAVPNDGANAALQVLGNTSIGNQRLPVRFTIDSARGLIHFDQPMFKNLALNNVIPDTGGNGFPDLYIKTGFRIRNIIGMAFQKFTAAGSLAVNGDPLCPPEVIHHPELVAVVSDTRIAANAFQITGTLDNIDSDLLPAANYYLQAANQKYEIDGTSGRTYSGIIPFSPDGAIQQMTWSVGGGRPATTVASRNTEHNVFVPNYPERRRKEQILNFFRKADAGVGRGGPVNPPVNFRFPTA
ncbi:MAG TPA: hypothetical protein VGL71_06150 [Urbifossiella sp.]